MSPHFDSWASVTTICSCFFYVATQQQLLMAKVQEVNANLWQLRQEMGQARASVVVYELFLFAPD